MLFITLSEALMIDSDVRELRSIKDSGLIFPLPLCIMVLRISVYSKF